MSLLVDLEESDLFYEPTFRLMLLTPIRPLSLYSVVPYLSKY
jgi:hypothetical protein